MRQGVRPAKSTRSGSMRIETLSQRSNLNIQRLFTDKIEIYDVVQSTTISVTSGIIKIALKAMRSLPTFFVGATSVLTT